MCVSQHKIKHRTKYRLSGESRKVDRRWCVRASAARAVASEEELDMDASMDGIGRRSRASSVQKKAEGGRQAVSVDSLSSRDVRRDGVEDDSTRVFPTHPRYSFLPLPAPGVTELGARSRQRHMCRQYAVGSSAVASMIRFHAEFIYCVPLPTPHYLL